MNAIRLSSALFATTTGAVLFYCVLAALSATTAIVQGGLAAA